MLAELSGQHPGNRLDEGQRKKARLEADLEIKWLEEAKTLSRSESGWKKRASDVWEKATPEEKRDTKFEELSHQLGVANILVKCSDEPIEDSTSHVDSEPFDVDAFLTGLNLDETNVEGDNTEVDIDKILEGTTESNSPKPSDQCTETPAPVTNATTATPQDKLSKATTSVPSEPKVEVKKEAAQKQQEWIRKATKALESFMTDPDKREERAVSFWDTATDSERGESNFSTLLGKLVPKFSHKPSRVGTTPLVSNNGVSHPQSIRTASRRLCNDTDPWNGRRLIERFMRESIRCQQS